MGSKQTTGPFEPGVLHECVNDTLAPRDWWSGGAWVYPGDMILETNRSEYERAKACCNVLASIESPALVMDAARRVVEAWENVTEARTTGGVPWNLDDSLVALAAALKGEKA